MEDRRDGAFVTCGDRSVERPDERFISETTVAKRFLDHLGLDSRGPPVARAQAPPDVLDPAPSYDGADSTFPD